MAETRDTGGPAFPRAMGWNGLTQHEEHEDNAPQMGMLLRDYYAAHALAALMTATFTSAACLTSIRESAAEAHCTVEAYTARCAYDYADAMLAQRAKS